jgi:hypothetical protein
MTTLPDLIHNPANLSFVTAILSGDLPLYEFEFDNKTVRIFANGEITGLTDYTIKSNGTAFIQSLLSELYQASQSLGSPPTTMTISERSGFSQGTNG